LVEKPGSNVSACKPRSPLESTLVEMLRNVTRVPSGLTMRSLPACSATKSLPSGANSMSMGFVKPLTTRESVKPGGRFAAPRADPTGKTNRVATEASNASAAAIDSNSRTAFLILPQPFRVCLSRYSAHGCACPQAPSRCFDSKHHMLYPSSSQSLSERVVHREVMLRVMDPVSLPCRRS
jgi:hypothetical protein